MWRRGSKCRYGCFSTSFAISRSPMVSSLMHMTLKSSRRACLTRAGNQTSTTWRSLRSLLLHIICKRYLEQTSSHLIGKLKSFVMARMSFGQACEEPTLKWTSTVESSWHELQGVKRFDPEAPCEEPTLKWTSTVESSRQESSS